VAPHRHRNEHQNRACSAGPTGSSHPAYRLLTRAAR
jgi:hypothetical protein